MGSVLSTGTTMDTIFQCHILNFTFKCHESLIDCFREEASLNPALCIFLKSNGSVCSRPALAIGLNVKINSPMRIEAHGKICLSFVLPSLFCQAVLPKGGTGNVVTLTISLCCFSLGQGHSHTALCDAVQAECGTMPCVYDLQPHADMPKAALTQGQRTHASK